MHDVNRELSEQEKNSVPDCAIPAADKTDDDE